MMKAIENEASTLNPNCAVCLHPQRSAGLSMFQMGASTEEIAEALRVSAGDVERHFQTCVRPISDGDVGANLSDTQLRQLVQHSLETYHASSLVGNQVGAAAALSVRLRALNELNKRADLRTERESLFDGANPCQPDTWPEELRLFLRKMFDHILMNYRNQKESKLETVCPTPNN